MYRQRISPNRSANLDNLTAVMAAALLSAGLCLPAAAQSTNFQRIRTFDPTRGLVPGNGSQSSPSPQNYGQNYGQNSSPGNSAAGNSAGTGLDGHDRNVTPQDVSNQDEQSSRHKHHHKFLIFGHHEEQDSAMPENSVSTESESAINTGKTVTRRVQSAPEVLQSLPATAPIGDPTTYSSMPIVMPRTGAVISPVTPPDAPRRPQSPAIDANARLPAVQNSGVKPALAWRARAWRLSTEPEDAATLTRHPSKVLNCSIEEALAAAANCCKSKGAQIIGQSLAAGQLGARFSDSTNGRATVIFVAKSAGNNRTILKACADSDRAQKIALVNDLISQTAAIIDGKGLL